MLRQLAVLFAAALVAGCNGGTPTGTQSSASNGALPSPPPWAAPADPTARMRAAGLEPLASEGTLVHYHPHIDVFYNGAAVTVPANVGIDLEAHTISALHTHADSGVLHIESPKAQTITLGQFFTEWNVPLAGAKVYLFGKPVDDPANLSLADHQEIAIVFGTAPATIPDTYNGAWY